jgi:hypothetical protein
VRARLKRWAILFRVVSAVFFAKVELIWVHSSLIGRSGGEPLSQQVSGGRFLIGAWGPFLEENAEYEMADDLTEPEAVSCFTVPAAGISVVYASQHSKQLPRCIFKKHPPEIPVTASRVISSLGKIANPPMGLAFASDNVFSQIFTCSALRNV